MRLLKSAAMLAFIINASDATAASYLAPSVQMLNARLLDVFSVYSGTYLSSGADVLLNGAVMTKTSIVFGAGTRVYGNVITAGYLASGAHVRINGTVLTSAASAFDVGTIVLGNIISGAATATGAQTFVAGSIRSFEATTVGADNIIGGSIDAGAGVTVGASTTVAGSLASGAAVTVGASAAIDGTIEARAAVSLGAGATSGLISQIDSSPVTSDPATLAPNNVSAIQLEIENAKASFSNMAPTGLMPIDNTVDMTVLSGVYSLSSFSLAANTTLYLDGNNELNPTFLFNILNDLTTGAGTNIVLINYRGDMPTIIWNLGGFAAIGADSVFMGKIFATKYISVGAMTKILSPEKSCSGMYSDSYISFGAGVAAGCRLPNRQLIDQYGNARDEFSTQVPEPTAWLMMITGFGLIGATARRRRMISTATRANAF